MTTEPSQTIWIARHATRIDNVDPAWSATAERPFDPMLAPQGFLEAERLAERLANEPVEGVIASPFLRAVQTATPIAAAADVPVCLEPGLCEWLKSDWFTEVPQLLPTVDVGWPCDRLDRTYASPAVMCHPEQWEDVATRTHETIHRLAATGRNLVVVGHGASVICCVAALRGVPAEHVPPPPLASLNKLERRGDRWHLVYEADTEHLEADGSAVAT